jgi:hypothetical protein
MIIMHPIPNLLNAARRKTNQREQLNEHDSRTSIQPEVTSELL